MVLNEFNAQLAFEPGSALEESGTKPTMTHRIE
jgi:hypothetical protein